MKYTDGSELRSWQQPVASAVDGYGLTANSELAQLPRTGYLAYTDRSGSTVAMGYGVPSQISYARALYGNDDLSLMASELNASTLADLAQGGYHFAYGTSSGRTRASRCRSARRQPASYCRILRCRRRRPSPTRQRPSWASATSSTIAGRAG